MRGLQERGIIRRNKMLHAAIALFLEHGYEKTTTAQIARQAGMSPASFFAAFENKEALLLALTKIMFSGQFQKAEGMLAEVKSPLLLYGLETALQLHITELSEPLREVPGMIDRTWNTPISSASRYVTWSTWESRGSASARRRSMTINATP